jgi:hypothetical protein
MALGVLLLILFAAVFYVRLGETTVKFKIDDPSLAVHFGNQEITIDNDGQKIQITPGEKQSFTVAQNGGESQTAEFTLRKGQKLVLRISLEKDEIAIHPDQPDLALGMQPPQRRPLPAAEPKQSSPQITKSQRTSEPSPRARAGAAAIAPLLPRGAVAGNVGDDFAEVTAFAIAEDRNAALVAKPSRLRVLDLDSNRELSAWSGAGNVVAASADGRMFAAGSSQVGSSIDLKVLRAPGNSGVFPGHPKQFLRSLAFSPDGRLLASSAMQGIEAERNAAPVLAERVLRVWNVDWKESGEPQEANWPLPPLLKSPGRNDRIDLDSVRFSPGGRWLVAVGDVMHYGEDGSLGEIEDFAFLWDVPNRSLVRRLDHVRTHATKAAFSPDEKLLVTGHAGTKVESCVLRVWDVETGRVLREVRGHDSPIFSLDVSPDGTFVASVDAKGRLRVWRLTDGQVVATLEGVESSDVNEANRSAPRLAAAFLADNPSWVSAGTQGRTVWALYHRPAPTQGKAEK